MLAVVGFVAVVAALNCAESAAIDLHSAFLGKLDSTDGAGENAAYLSPAVELNVRILLVLCSGGVVSAVNDWYILGFGAGAAEFIPELVGITLEGIELQLFIGEELPSELIFDFLHVGRCESGLEWGLHISYRVSRRLFIPGGEFSGGDVVEAGSVGIESADEGIDAGVTSLSHVNHSSAVG